MSQDLLQIRIQPMRPQDLEAIMAIEPQAFGSHHWSLQSFENELNNQSGSYFTATSLAAFHLVGYSGFWLIGEEVHITTLAVHPNFQRQYVGERLLINNILEAKKVGARWITLEVRISNKRAQNLYFKYGFKSISVRKNYYQDNDEDALVLWTENIETARFSDLLEQRIEALEYQFSEHIGEQPIQTRV